MIYRDFFEFESGREISFKDVTANVKKIVEESGISEGLCNIFFSGTTGGLMVNENDRMLLEDFDRMFKNLIDERRVYNHPYNASSHLRSVLVKMDLTIPIANSHLILGKWQSIMFWDFGNKSRKRRIIVTLEGE